MNQQEFLETVLPSGGYYCLFLIKKGTKGNGFNKFYTTIRDLVAAAQTYSARYNVFFATATFKEETDRLADSTSQINTFFLDIDSKDVGSKAVALERVKLLCKVLSLPKPVMVDSGHGMHFYWVLDKPVSTAKWRPVAAQFKKVCKQKDVGADPSVTADAARVLRLPESYNYKYDPVKLCKVVSGSKSTISFKDFSDAVGFDQDAEILDASKVTGLFSSTDDRLAGNYESKFADVIAEGGCQHLRKAVEENATLSEPHWFSALAVAKHCTDADVYMIKLSEDHEDYSYDNMVKKAAHAEYPHTCETLQGHRSDWCQNCPHLGKIKSPIVLGNDVVEREVDEAGFYVDPPKVVEGKRSAIDGFKIPKAPVGFMIGKEGGVYGVEVDEEGNKSKTLITKNTLYGVARTYDRQEHTEAMIMRLHLPNDPPRTIVLPNDVTSSTDKLRESLSKYGLVTERQKELRRYVMAWIERFQEMGRAKDPITQFGWTDGTMREFVLGENIYTEKGVELALPSSATAAYVPYFDKRGTLDKWKSAVQLWNRKEFVQQQYALCTGLGSLLMPLDNTDASILHLYSKESGVGKTAILLAIQSAFGDPKEMMTAHADTHNMKMKKLETWHNLPVCIDEITNITPSEASELIYQVSGGRQKARMKASSNEERPRGKPWTLTTITTSNTSLLSRLAGTGGKSDPQAETQRVLEMYLGRKFTDASGKKQTDVFNSVVSKNYGHAGPLIVQYIIDNPEHVKLLVEQCRSAIDKKADFSSENRYWSGQTTTALAMCKIGKLIGLWDFDLPYLFHFIINDLVNKNKAASKETIKSNIEVVNEYLNENTSNILIIRDDKAPEVGGMPIPAERNALRHIAARLESSTGELSICCSLFKKWCANAQIDYRNLEEMLRKDYHAKVKKKRISTGTSLTLSAITCIVIPNYNMLDDAEED